LPFARAPAKKAHANLKGLVRGAKIRSPRIFYFCHRNSLLSHSSHAVNCGDFWLTLSRKNKN